MQESESECHIDRLALYRIAAELDATTDDAMECGRWYSVCRWCRECIEWQEVGAPAREAEYFIV